MKIFFYFILLSTLFGCASQNKEIPWLGESISDLRLQLHKMGAIKDTVFEWGGGKEVNPIKHVLADSINFFGYQTSFSGLVTAGGKLFQVSLHLQKMSKEDFEIVSMKFKSSFQNHASFFTVRETDSIKVYGWIANKECLQDITVIYFKLGDTAHIEYDTPSRFNP